MLNVKLIQFDSDDYHNTLELRERLLRAPLGLTLSQYDLQDEDKQFHFAAFSDASLAGACVIKPDKNHSYQLRQMAVDSDFQGLGIGHRLIEAFETHLKALACKEIWMNARTSAQAFYEKKGYQVKSEVFDHLGVEHVKMVKNMA